MGILNSNKEINKTIIDCLEDFNLKISLTAEPDIVNNPVDIALLLDISGSMKGEPLVNLKIGAKKFIQIIDEATDNTGDGQIGNDSKIGIVSFSSNATIETDLISSVEELNIAIDRLASGGETNHYAAFEKGLELLSNGTNETKIMVMFTDGKTTIGPDPNDMASLAKSKGIIIYCIGLNGDKGLDVDALNNWSSDPDSAYVAIAPDEAALEEIFKDLALNISKPGATNIEIIEQLNDCFKINSILQVSKGNCEILNENTIKWNIDSLGVSKSEGALLELNVGVVSDCSGEIIVNKDITYNDNEDNVVNFPTPKINIVCHDSDYVEECPVSKEIAINNCVDSVEYDAEDIYLNSLGRILQVNATIKNVCPNKRVALAVILTEIDDSGQEHKRGMKTYVIPKHSNPRCKDIRVKCIKFVLPEVLSDDMDCSSLCKKRKFKVRFIASYIDFDFDCCSTLN